MARSLSQARGAAFVLLLLCATGCSTVRFYTQAVQGQFQVIHRQQSIERLLAATNTPPDLRHKLELVLKLRRFAETDLNLPANGHYLRYADLERDFVVWNVEAAPEFSLEAKGWWYPIVGRQTYRGYFDEALARDYARHLAAKGHDVHVGGVEAYSTLGWFRDPVLNTFLDRDETGLADLIFHELAHQRLFLRNDTDFNEAFAVAVAREGVRRWLASKADATALTRWQTSERCEEQFVKLVQQTRRELEALFGKASEGKTDEELRAEKAVIIEVFRQKVDGWRKQSGCNDYTSWLEKPVNNARLNTVATYFDLVPGFERLLRECDHDLERFFQAVERLAKVPKARRRQILSTGIDTETITR